MAEKLGEAVLELRTDDSALVSGMAKAKASAQELDRSFTSVGGNVERSLGRAASSSKATGLAASELAVAAQTSARAAVDQAAGFGAAAKAARVNTLAMRESLVVVRELSRGNFSRVPGSLSLLAQGVGSQGGIGAFASAVSQQLGLIKQVQNAELAEAAAAAANAAAGVEAAARLAAAKVIVADTELALAQAQVRVTEGTAAEVVAQARLAAAHEAVAVAALEARVGEDALAVAMGRAAETGAASAAATRTVIGGTGIGLIGLSIVAATAYGAIKQFQDQVKDSGELDAYADKLNLTDAQIKKLGGSVTYLGHNIKEVHGLTVSFGDVMYGVWHEIAREVSDPGPWNAMADNAATVFNWMLGAWSKVSAGISAGLMSMAHFTLEMAKGGMHGADLTKMDVLGDLQSRYADELKRNQVAFAGIEAAALAHRRKTLQDLSDGNNPRAPKKSKKESDHGLADALAKLDAEIKGQYALAAAYGVSAAAAQRAEAQQKAAEDAISHKGTADQFYAKELQKAVATDVARQAKANAALDLENSIRAQLNGEVIAGTTSLAAYNDKLKLQTTLNALNADLENADAAHKKVILDLIKQTIDQDTESLQLKAQLAAITDEHANDNEIDRLRLENSLMGVSNKERAVALAQLEAMQKLKEIDPNGLLTRSERQGFIKSYTDKANASVTSPFQQWAQSIPQTADRINQELQGIEVRGFDGLTSAITGVITGTESLKQAFGDLTRSILADIVQMIVKMLIFRAVSAIFGGGFTPMSVDLGSTAAAPMPHFAKGGFLPIGGNGGVDRNLLSINGQPRAMVGADETLAVIPRGSGFAANNNPPPRIVLEVTGNDLWQVKVAEVSNAVVEMKTPGIVGQAVKSTIKQVSKKRIGS